MVRKGSCQSPNSLFQSEYFMLLSYLSSQSDSEFLALPFGVISFKEIILIFSFICVKLLL